MKLLAVASSFVTLISSLSAAQGPTTYCTAGVTSSFCVAQITASAQPNVVNTAGCVITTSGLPGNRQGVVFYGVDNSGFTPSIWGGAGGSSYLCVQAPTKRLGAALNSGGTAGQCNGVFVVDWDAFQIANPTALGNPWSVGDTVFVQSWYRDPLAVKTSNLSNATELTLRAPVPTPCVSAVPGLVLVPAGTFFMGSNAANGPPYFGEYNDPVVRQVTISYCFWMGATEVTQAQYTALMGTNPAWFPGANNPIETVSWFDAQAYCAALTVQQSAQGGVPAGYHYRLPTEAEWEYACRAGTTTEFNVGASLFCNQAKFGYSDHSNSVCGQTGTAPVASFAPNAWGLHDMHGNVFEWCLDSHAAYAAGPVTDPFVTGGTWRLLRGGSWYDNTNSGRSARRVQNPPSTAGKYFGFRVVLAPILVP
ncbi:MAG: formylglycine-generating enzyme family protein [Planctomycetes bacterium]|nr:formylglycine-generating enzyme family protein [Planctomycetota bacterium]